MLEKELCKDGITINIKELHIHMQERTDHHNFYPDNTDSPLTEKTEEKPDKGTDAPKSVEDKHKIFIEDLLHDLTTSISEIIGEESA